MGTGKGPVNDGVVAGFSGLIRAPAQQKGRQMDRRPTRAGVPRAWRGVTGLSHRRCGRRRGLALLARPGAGGCTGRRGAARARRRCRVDGRRLLAMAAMLAARCGGRSAAAGSVRAGASAQAMLWPISFSIAATDLRSTARRS